MNRRFFLLAAPAIVAAPSLMKVSALHIPEVLESTLPDSVWQFPIMPARIRNKLLHGAGLYSGYDGYEIVQNEWERSAQSIRLTF
jgi:hypothetical protein